MRRIVQRIIYFGEIKESFHSAHERSSRNITQDDILAMLEGEWKLGASPEWDENHKSWKYRLNGYDIDGDELALVIGVNEELQRITVITKF